MPSARRMHLHVYVRLDKPLKNFKIPRISIRSGGRRCGTFQVLILLGLDFELDLDNRLLLRLLCR